MRPVAITRFIQVPAGKNAVTPVIMSTTRVVALVKYTTARVTQNAVTPVTIQRPSPVVKEES